MHTHISDTVVAPTFFLRLYRKGLKSYIKTLVTNAYTGKYKISLAEKTLYLWF